MLKRDEIATPTSCLNSAKDDEPIFTLRANDPLAAEAVRDWARKYIGSKMRYYPTVHVDFNQNAKYHEALQLADLMDAWRAEQIRNAK